MYSKIIVPVDPAHKERCAEMLEKANFLAGKDAEIVVVSVLEIVPIYAAAMIPDTIIDDMRSGLRNDLDAAVAKIETKTKIVAAHGTPSSSILKCANDENADLIVINSHDPNMSDYILGSTASRVVRHAHCSVLVIR